MIHKYAALRPASIGFAILIVGGSTAVPQTMPGLETKKVKTIPIHRDGTFGQRLTPGASTSVAPPSFDVPTVKVPTIRIGPTGAMTYPPPRGPDRK